MKFEVTLWKEDKLLFIALLFLLFFNWVWPRVLLRTYFEWETFQWANILGINSDGTPIVMRGVGIYGASWYLMLFTIVLVVLLYMGCRQRNGAFKGFVLAYTGMEFAKALFFSYHLGGPDYVIAWDTLHTTVPLTILDPATHGATFLLFLAWVLRERKNPPKRTDVSWNHWNTKLVMTGIFCNVILFITLNIGLQHGFWDIFSLLIMDLGFILIFLGFGPLKLKTS